MHRTFFQIRNLLPSRQLRRTLWVSTFTLMVVAIMLGVQGDLNRRASFIKMHPLSATNSLQDPLPDVLLDFWPLLTPSTPSGTLFFDKYYKYKSSSEGGGSALNETKIWRLPVRLPRWPPISMCDYFLLTFFAATALFALTKPQRWVIFRRGIFQAGVCYLLRASTIGLTILPQVKPDPNHQSFENKHQAKSDALNVKWLENSDDFKGRESANPADFDGTSSTYSADFAGSASSSTAPVQDTAFHMPMPENGQQADVVAFWMFATGGNGHDFIFSGHTALLCILSSIWVLYASSVCAKFAGLLVGLVCITMVSLDRLHYTVDIVLGAIVSLCVIFIYMLLVVLRGTLHEKSSIDPQKFNNNTCTCTCKTTCEFSTPYHTHCKISGHISPSADQNYRPIQSSNISAKYLHTSANASSEETINFLDADESIDSASDENNELEETSKPNKQTKDFVTLEMLPDGQQTKNGTEISGDGFVLRWAIKVISWVECQA